MKIRLTRETLGLPVGTVLSCLTDGMREGGDIRLDFQHDGYGYIWIPEGSWEAVPEPTEADRLRDELAKAEAEIQSYIQAEELWKRRVERRKLSILSLEGELQQARQRIAELEAAQASPQPQYRMLEPGEIIQEGDEWDNGEGFVPYKSGRRNSIGHTFNPEDYFPHRRLVG